MTDLLKAFVDLLKAFVRGINLSISIVFALIFFAILLVGGFVMVVGAGVLLGVLKTVELFYGWTTEKYRELKYRVYPSLRPIRRHELRRTR